MADLKEAVKPTTTAAAPKSDVLEGFEDFEVLTQAQLKELAREDPAELTLYTARLTEYRHAQHEANAKRAREEQTEVEEQNAIFAEANRLMEEAVPGLFDRNSTAQQALETHAVNMGFTSDLFYLTNPATKVILPDSDKPVLLGTQAAKIVKFLQATKDKASPVDVETLRETIRKEEASKLLAKLKNHKGFRSLTTTADSDIETGVSRFGQKVLPMNELVTLSPEEQEAYLQGQ
jgi:hypothetical protein